MSKRIGILCALGVAALLAVADDSTAAANLTAEQIVAKHISARGGLAAWHAVQTMSWTGKMDVGSGDSVARSKKFAGMETARKSKKPLAADSKAVDDKQVQLPFVVDMKRPQLSRVEIVFAGKTAVQVYDGRNGWKLRPFLNRSDVEPFTQEELQASAGKWEMDGPLLGAASKGSKVELEAAEPVEGHDAYRLKVTASSGEVQHIWIDAQSFLDVKVEGTPRRMDGKMRTVWIYQRDFRSVQGVMVPYLLETAVDGYRDTHKMMIDKIAVNPELDDALFAKPSGA